MKASCRAGTAQVNEIRLMCRPGSALTSVWGEHYAGKLCAWWEKLSRLLRPSRLGILEYSLSGSSPVLIRRAGVTRSIDFQANSTHLGVVDTPNQVEIPIIGIEDALIQCAVPGFWGQLIIGVRLLRSAALEIELQKETKTVAQSDSVAREAQPIAPSNDRVQKVRNRMAEVKEKLRVFCPVTSIRGAFKDGHLVSLEITELEDLSPVPFPIARNTKVIR